MSDTEPLVHYRDETPPIYCPYGEVQRIVTGGAGGVANVHVVRVTAGGRHLHSGYDETYYVLSGSGTITIGERTWPLRPGAVSVIPRNHPHELRAAEGETLEFVIFGTPAMDAADPRFVPRKAE